MRHFTLASPSGRNALGNPLIYAAATLICVILESWTGFDRFFQSPFFTDGCWLLPKKFHSEWKIILYTGPKIVIALLGSLFLLILPMTFRRRKKRFLTPAWRKPVFLIVLSIALVPLITGAAKAVTGVYSPVDVTVYGGNHPHIGLMEQLWLFGQFSGGKSFPAGHASGGFALISLYYLPVSESLKKSLFMLGLTAGWLMGLYQMSRGEHFMSHTLTTMFLALTVISFLAGKLRLQ